MTDAPLSPVPPDPPPVFDPNLFPSRHRPLRQWIFDHNPFLLLSTVCMLLGCYLVNAALQGQGSTLKILGLLAVINVYEACIIPLGLTLIRRTRGTARDGWWLLLFEILFLVNATFVNVDFGLSWGIPFNLLLLVLACVKAAIVMHGLKIGLGLRTFGFFALQLAIVYGLPIFFAFMQRDGVVSPRVMYALWWLVGLLPALYGLLARFDHPRQWDLVQQVVRRVYLIAPWVMLVIHLRFSHWAHHAPFALADVAPILLGVAVASLRLPRTSPVRPIAWILPAVAMILSLDGGALSWSFSLGEVHRIVPAHFTVVASALAWGYLASPFHMMCAAITVTLVSTGYLFQNLLVAALRWAWRTLLWLLPDTMLAWGVVAIAVAFGLLAVGTYLSLKRTAAPTAPPPDPVL